MAQRERGHFSMLWLGGSNAQMISSDSHARVIARDLFSGRKLARVLSFIMVAMAAAPAFHRSWAAA